ncbi:MAG: hypothetical protein GY864_07420 [Desulfobacterales bacterium]|nr:hypothetical protein [Desulfobacterales bacterium]
MTEENKRRKFYQKELTLYRSIFSFFVISGLGVAILAVLYVFVSSMIISMIVDKGAIQSVAGPTTIIGKVLVSYWLYIIVGGLFLVAVSVFYTHRFAGPLYRFEASIDRMIDKDIGFEIGLRKNDECQSLAEKINKLNSELSTTVKSMSTLVEEVDNIQIGLYKELGGKNKTLKNAIVSNRKLQKILKDFKCT